MGALIIPDEVLRQGSTEWLKRRQTWVTGGTDSAIIAGEPPPYQGSAQTWFQKRKKVEGGTLRPLTGPAIDHGLRWEAVATRYFDPEAITQKVVLERELEPNVLVGASLDGFDGASGKMIEVKCPFTQKESATYRDILKGEVPRHYWWQLVCAVLAANGSVTQVAFCVFISQDPNSSKHKVWPASAFEEDAARLESEIIRYASGEAQFPPESFDYLSEQFLEVEAVLNEGLRLLKPAEDRKAELENRIKEHPDKRGKLLRVGAVRGRLGLDKKALEKRHPRLLQRYMRRGEGHERLYRI